MLIAQLSDIHIGFDQSNPAGELNLLRLRCVVERLLDGPNRADLLILSGDVTDLGDAPSYARLADELANLPMPVMVMAGNHDLREPLVEAFPATVTEDGFVQSSFVQDGLRIILLDTVETGRHGGAFCQARADWLKAQLAGDPDMPTVIFMHHPPMPTGIDWMDPDPDEPWIARFTAAIEGHSQLRTIVCGHVHRGIATQFAGVPLTVCPSCAPAVTLDLNVIDPDEPDGRVLITEELPGYALHWWDGTRFVSHFERVGRLEPLARYGAPLQPMIRAAVDERRAEALREQEEGE